MTTIIRILNFGRDTCRRPPRMDLVGCVLGGSVCLELGSVSPDLGPVSPYLGPVCLDLGPVCDELKIHCMMNIVQ